MDKLYFGYDIYQIHCFDILPFLNEISNKRIKLHRIKKIDQFTYQFYAFTLTRKKIYTLDYDIEYIKSVGVLNYIRRLFTNRITLIGMSSFIITFYLLSMFVWRVEIIGDYQAINKQIASLLPYFEISTYDRIKSQMQLEIINSQLRNELKGSVDWINTFRMGNIYQIQYTKKYDKERTGASYQNLYACRDGVIKQFIVRSGNIVVKQNNYVKLGQLLVENNIIDTNQDMHIVAVDGRVMANTWYNVSTSINAVIDEGEAFTELQRLSRAEISKALDEYDSIEKEVIILFEKIDGQYVMKTHYTLLENIACK